MAQLSAATPALLTDDEVALLAGGRAADPFAILGPRQRGGVHSVAVFVPGARAVRALSGGTEWPLAPAGHGAFCGPVPPGPYRLAAEDAGGARREWDDPYRFGPVIGPLDEHLLSEGTHLRLWAVLGAHVVQHEGVAGTHFAVWAPNARRVSVVGDFNDWDGRLHPMRPRGATGVWELFLPGIAEGARYKYEIVGPDGTIQPLKADPAGFGAEHPPATASVVRDIAGYGWRDGDWMAHRAARHARSAPISIYEVHLGSWRRRAAEGGRALSWREAADELVAYVHDMGFTHIELLPVSEHPFDGSWGYQPVGLYAPTIRFGPPHEFRDLVDAAHARGIGILIDWVPGHFPTDAHGLAQFDGTALYEHADPKEGFHNDWNTLIYNPGRREVANFLIANALYWLLEYHVDGLRVDAVASMLYRDYSRPEGGWVPNIHGGRENLEAIALLRRTNEAIVAEVPGAITLAEESTSFPGVSHPVGEGGLGFSYKWNMGWMNDTLAYMHLDPVHRRHHHERMTFGLLYAFSEGFVLPISHDEVVHGKGSMLAKMPGPDRFANLRAYYGFMWGHPGKKLLFMGCEFAQPREWAHHGELDWACLADPAHAGMQRLVRDLNTLYRSEPALHARDCDPGGFEWIEPDAREISVLAWVRHGFDGDPPAVVLCNFTPVERRWTCGLPAPGRWREALNTDAALYGGGNRGNLGGIVAVPADHPRMPCAAEVLLPPLSTVILILDRSDALPGRGRA
jgi:1,4-alpha-glucan branching enzyme